MIHNIPITHADIKAAEDIFGPNLRSLKGKTVTQPGPHIDGCIEGVPLLIKEKFQTVVMGIDIMFMNKILFLVTTSCRLHFGTIKNLKNCQLSTVSAVLDKVIGLYTH